MGFEMCWTLPGAAPSQDAAAQLERFAAEEGDGAQAEAAEAVGAVAGEGGEGREDGAGEDAWSVSESGVYQKWSF